MGLLEEAVQLALTVSTALYCGPVGCVADGEVFADTLGPSRFNLTFNGDSLFQVSQLKKCYNLVVFHSLTLTLLKKSLEDRCMMIVYSGSCG